jgi:hypothetical protein
MKIIIMILMLAWGIFATPYYIDFTAANDGGAGTKAAPWKHAPAMRHFTGTYTHVAGDSMIFKGGITWDSTCFSMIIRNSGTSNSVRDYYGIDSTWYTGGSFTRPKFTCDNKYPDTLGMLIYLKSAKHVIIDGIEICKMRCFTSYETGLIVSNADVDERIRNCYIHGWYLADTVFKDEQHGGVYGSGSSYRSEFVVENCEIENSEWEAVQNNGHCITFADTVKNCKLHDAPTMMLHVMIAHHNEIYNCCYPNDPYYPQDDPVTPSRSHHQNMWYGEPFTAAHEHGGGAAKFYNNYVHHLGSVGTIIFACAAGASNGYPCPIIDTIYVYNNLIFTDSATVVTAILNACGVNTIDSVRCGVVVAYNNIFQSKYSNRIMTSFSSASPRDTLHGVDIRNNLYICPQCSTGMDSLTGFGNDPVHGYAKSYKNNHNIGITPAKAELIRLKRDSLYRQLTISDTTIGKGVNFSSVFTTDYNDINRTVPWSVGSYQKIFQSNKIYINIRRRQ